MLMGGDRRPIEKSMSLCLFQVKSCVSICRVRPKIVTFESTEAPSDWKRHSWACRGARHCWSTTEATTSSSTSGCFSRAPRRTRSEKNSERDDTIRLYTNNKILYTFYNCAVTRNCSNWFTRTRCPVASTSIITLCVHPISINWFINVSTRTTSSPWWKKRSSIKTCISCSHP